MSVISSLEWRYATKKFNSTKKLSNQQIETLKNAFNLTPTSFGLQPLKLIIIQNNEIQEKLVEYCYYQQQVVEASHVLIICIEKETTVKDINSYFDLEKETREIDESVIAKFRKDLIAMYANKTIEEKQFSAINQAYIALGNLLTVCAIEKIDTCPMEGFIPEKINELLNLNSLNLKSVLLLPVGFRADDDLMSSLKKVRKPIEEIVIEIS